MSDAIEIAPGIRQLDTLLGGMDQLTAGFLVDGPMPALIETGSQSSVPAVNAALAALGLGPADLRWIIVTHIHLDHAGAVGDLARDFPSATIVVHERGARHLVDPSKLIDSASRVYGPLLDSLYGRMTAVPEDRLIAAADGFRVDVGNGRELVLVDSPGHAKHHHAVLDEQTGTLLVGDAVGVLLPDIGVLRPATPPPDFDLEQADAQPSQVCGAAPAAAGPDALRSRGRSAGARSPRRRRCCIAGSRSRPPSWRAPPTRGSTTWPPRSPMRSPRPPRRSPGGAQEKVEVLNGVHSNAAGIVRYLSRRATAAPAE